MLERLRGEEITSELCRRECTTAWICYSLSNEFLKAGRRRLSDDTARVATLGKVPNVRRHASVLKKVTTKVPASKKRERN